MTKTGASRNGPAGPCPYRGDAAFSGRDFDPFGPAYQADPAEALRTARDSQPVFYSDALGYWVVSRYVAN